MDKKLDTYISLGLMFLAVTLIISSQVIAENNDKILNVLFISSFSKDIPAQIDFEKGINKAIGNTNAQDNVFYEFIDASRLNEKYTKEVFAGYLESKYQGIAFDFVVGWSSSAIQFLKLNKNLFMDSNRVYIGAPSKDSNKIWVQSTSARELIINVGHDYREPTLEILRLEQPKYIYVIATTTDTTAKIRLQCFKDGLPEDTSNYQIEYLLDQTLEQVASKLANIKTKKAIAIYLLMFSDGKGKHITPYDAAQYLTSRSAVPIYSYWKALMGSGLVGGYLFSHEQVGFNLVKTMHSHQKGEAIAKFSPMSYIYDWTALKKWKINVNKLPEEAIILNRPVNVFVQYKGYILSAGIVIALLTLLSLFLFRALEFRNIAVNELAVERKNLEITVDERTRELVHANKDLMESENRFRSLADAAFEGIAIAEKMKILLVNDALVKMFGYKESEVINRAPVDFIDPDFKEDIKEKIDSGYEGAYECVGIRKDGIKVPVEIHSRAFLYKERPARVVSIRDLTEKKLTEEALRQSEERLRNIYQTAPVAFVVWDKNNKTTNWNKKAEEIFGWTKAEVIGHSVFDFIVPDKDRPHVETIIRNLMKGELQSHSINDNLTKSGKTITCEWENSILHDNAGNIVGAISIGLDITDRIRAEEERIEKEKIESIIEMAGTMCHELSQPLQIISGSAELLAACAQGDEYTLNKLDNIVDQIERMRILLQKLISITRYKTKAYGRETKIIDIDRSSSS